MGRCEGKIVFITGGAIIYLVSDDAKCANGTELVLDGGTSL